MYSKKSWGGSVDPFILVTFPKDKIAVEKGEDPVVSLLIFEWQDKQLLGKPSDADYMEVSCARLGCTRLLLRSLIFRAEEIHLR